jgi:rare lipoprotein A
MKPFIKIKSFFNITIRISLFIVIGFLLPSVAKKEVVPSIEVFEEGKASFYCDYFVGRKTASGEIFTEHEYTCAHKYLPFGTLIKVNNKTNGESVVVKVNDRGPFVKGRIVDLSLKAAKDLDIMKSGVANVSIEIVNQEYSEVGNVKNMERVAIQDSYSFVHYDNQTLLDHLYELIFKLEDLKTSSIKNSSANN